MANVKFILNINLSPAIESSLSVNWDFRRLEEADIEGLITAVRYKEGKESRLHLGPQK